MAKERVLRNKQSRRLHLLEPRNHSFDQYMTEVFGAMSRLRILELKGTSA
jgi:hypothetical protein